MMLLRHLEDVALAQSISLLAGPREHPSCPGLDGWDNLFTHTQFMQCREPCKWDFTPWIPLCALRDYRAAILWSVWLSWGSLQPFPKQPVCTDLVSALYSGGSQEAGGDIRCCIKLWSCGDD